MPHPPTKVFKTFYLGMRSRAARLLPGWQPGVSWAGLSTAGGRAAGWSVEVPVPTADRASGSILRSTGAADRGVQLSFGGQAAVGSAGGTDGLTLLLLSHSRAAGDEKRGRFGGAGGMLCCPSCAASGTVCPASASSEGFDGRAKARAEGAGWGEASHWPFVG